jgi:hypothetical protein
MTRELANNVKMRDFDFNRIKPVNVLSNAMLETLLGNAGRILNSAFDILSSQTLNRNAWRDNLIARENELAELLQISALGEAQKTIISNALIEYSNEIHKLMYKDLEKLHPRSANVAVDIINSFANNSELNFKKKFWLDTIEMQNKVLMDVAKSDVADNIKTVACGLIVQNSNILIAGLKREINDEPIAFVMKRLRKEKQHHI